MVCFHMTWVFDERVPNHVPKISSRQKTKLNQASPHLIVFFGSFRRRGIDQWRKVGNLSWPVPFLFIWNGLFSKKTAGSIRGHVRWFLRRGAPGQIWTPEVGDKNVTDRLKTKTTDAGDHTESGKGHGDICRGHMTWVFDENVDFEMVFLEQLL